MSIKEDYSFAGKPVVTWQVGHPLPDPATSAIRLSVGGAGNHPDFATYFQAFLQLPGLEKVDTLLIGNWGAAYENSIRQALDPFVAAAECFPALRHLHLADIPYTESEVSWIHLGDISDLFPAFQGLQTLLIKGSAGLVMENIRLPQLETLDIVSAGLPARITQQIAAAELPKLRHLELWLGSYGHGCNLTPDDLDQLLDALPRFPALSHLALCNYELANQLAQQLAEHPPLPDSITHLDLSKGTLADHGAQALLTQAERLNRLERLDLHHHYLSDEMMATLSEQLSCRLNLNDQEEADYEFDEDDPLEDDEDPEDYTYRFIFLSE
ncbi:hypothetical protein [Marinobacterium weihaiense]|uniref:Leucine Rich repeat-containing protein n=1 Tax=Marinobacterium weihaiense TaxID=2851016 RepID=A0ABS6MCT6_9GAMM|nr:hypothetical protein [Marinobacterium weihaiense]MBV0933656.1 hypothetical protein [Marinobacterium weihaiense]